MILDVYLWWDTCLYASVDPSYLVHKCAPFQHLVLPGPVRPRLFNQACASLRWLSTMVYHWP